MPGLVVTQHSGVGKANQYFLRGLNLDHGTDFATWVAGMPVNLRTHAHGQGYTDLNFIIRELVEGSAGIYAENSTRWNDWFRSVIGLRYDWYRFDVDSTLAANSVVRSDGIVSAKLSLIFGPWQKTEFFVNGGYGFHSNDARGVTITVDPVTGDPADPATPLVRRSREPNSAFAPSLCATCNPHWRCGS